MAELPRVKPLKRTNPVSGDQVWVARYPLKTAKTKSAGTFKLMRDAQTAIDQAIEREWGGRTGPATTVGEYFADWLKRHPRSQRTNDTNGRRIRPLLDVIVADVPFSGWQIHELRRKHALELVEWMLVEQGRAVSGVRNVLKTLSAMTEDAITDEVCEVNAFRGVKVRATDPRAQKQSRPVRVFSFQDMHRFAAAAGPYEGLVRSFCDLGLRLGEAIPLRRSDVLKGPGGALVRVERTAWNGRLIEGTKQQHLHGERDGGRLVPAPAGWVAIIEAQVPRIDTPLLFAAPMGGMYQERQFYRDMWRPTQKRTGMDIRPHEMRHSWVSLLRAAGIDPADLADVSGHTVAVATAKYTHPLRRSYDAIREVVG